MERVWTKRGEMTDYDKEVIEGMVREIWGEAKTDLERGCWPVLRVLITGRVWVDMGKDYEDEDDIDRLVAEDFPDEEDYIGPPERAILERLNYLYLEKKLEPLFVYTEDDCLCMRRFDPVTVWKWIPETLLVQIIGHELDRFGTDGPMAAEVIEQGDFYKALFNYFYKKHGPVALRIPMPSDTSYRYTGAMYLSSILLFGKPGCYDIPVNNICGHPGLPALFRLENTRPLSPEERKQHAELCEDFGELNFITNNELSFIINTLEANSESGPRP